MFRLWPALAGGGRAIRHRGHQLDILGGMAVIDISMTAHARWQVGCPFRLETRSRLVTCAAEGCSILSPAL